MRMKLILITALLVITCCTTKPKQNHCEKRTHEIYLNMCIKKSDSSSVKIQKCIDNAIKIFCKE